jgi:hypothetical protein
MQSPNITQPVKNLFYKKGDIVFRVYSPQRSHNQESIKTLIYEDGQQGIIFATNREIFLNISVTNLRYDKTRSAEQIRL